MGEVALYRHPNVGLVIHRIVARQGERFTFGGDHNAWLDSFQPTQADIVGKLWLHVPDAGQTIVWLRQPLHIAILVGLLGVFLMFPLMTSQPRRGTRQGLQSPTTVQPATGHFFYEVREAVLPGLVTLIVAALLLALFAFNQPTTQTLSTDIPYRQTGTFTYSAPATGDLYPTGNVPTGSPVFPALSQQLEVGFTYEFITDQPAMLNGTYRLVAEIAAQNGWRHTLILQEPAAFVSGGLMATTFLDLRQLMALVDQYETATGLDRQRYTVSIIPEVTVIGTLAGQAVQDTFAPPLTFQFDKQQLQWVPSDKANADTLNPTQTGQVTATGIAPNTISLLGLKLDVVLARWLSLLGLVLGSTGLVVYGVWMARELRGGEVARIRWQYGSLLTDVRDYKRQPDVWHLQVAAIDDLARLAEKQGVAIFHASDGVRRDYFVPVNEVTYHYQAYEVEPSGLRRAEEGGL